jgi:quercetin dioxygenase-like cupin family protein
LRTRLTEAQNWRTAASAREKLPRASPRPSRTASAGSSGRPLVRCSVDMKIADGPQVGAAKRWFVRLCSARLQRFGGESSKHPRAERDKGMEIKRAGSQASAKGPSEWFTGTVRIDPLFQAPDPALVQGASVTFEPGARTAWHTHPLGQTLIVTSGYGRAQRWGGPVEEIRPGDVVWFSPGEKHWHGASPTTAMTHLAIQEKKDGKVVDWMEQVSDQQYQQG